MQFECFVDFFCLSSWFFRNALFQVSTSKYCSQLELYWNTKTMPTVCSYLVFSSANFLFSSCSVCPLIISHCSAGVWVIHIFGGFLMRTKHENIIPSSGWCYETLHPFNDAFAPCFIMIVGFGYSWCATVEELLSHDFSYVIISMYRLEWVLYLGYTSVYLILPFWNLMSLTYNGGACLMVKLLITAMAA